MTAAPAGNSRSSRGTRASGTTPSIRTGRWLAIGIPIVIIVLGILAVYAIISAKEELTSGAAELRVAETQLKAAPHGSASRTLQQVQASVVSAHDDFAAADVRLTPLAPILDHLGGLPRVGPRLAAGAPAARTADLTTSGILPLLTALQPIADEISRQHHAHPLHFAMIIRQLAASRPSFQQSCTSFAQAQAARSQVPATTDPSVTGPLHTFDQALPKLQELCAGLQVLPGILGYPRSRTYLVAYQDPLELRAEGGFIGSAGLLTLHDGTMHQQFASTAFMEYPGKSFGARDDLSIKPPQPVYLYNREPGWLFRDSNWSPNFPTSAQIEAYIFKADSHRSVDGVINLVPQAAADLLQATGPIYVPEYHRVVSAANVAVLSDYYSHLTSHQARQIGPRAYGPRTYGDWDTQRKQFIGIVARHIFRRLGKLNAINMQRLAAELQTAFAQKDLLLYFRNPVAESLVHLLGASGQIAPTTADYLYLVDDNLGFTKNNPWVHVRWQYHVHIRHDRWLDAHLTIHYRNVPAPLSYKAKGWWGPCGGRCGGWDDYATFLRIYVPNGAQLDQQSGFTHPWTPGPAYGKTEFDGYLLVRRGQSATVSLHYVIPPNVFAWSHGTQYRLVVQRQPGTHPDADRVQVSWGRDQSNRHVLLHPRRDWSTSVTIPRLPFHPVPLLADPAQPAVAPDHWIEPHTYLTPP